MSAVGGVMRSQLPNPLTLGGRIVDLMLEARAMSAVATLPASLAACFRARHVEEA